jgi:sulfite exporter TauE/SafE
LVLGLFGGTHCLAMCGPACVAIHARDNPAEKPLVFTPKKEAAQVWWHYLEQFIH